MAREKIEREISPAELQAPLDAQVAAILAQSPQGIALLGQREANAQIKAANASWEQLALKLTSEVFPQLSSLAGGLAAQSREGYESFGNAMARLTETLDKLAQKESPLDRVFSWAENNPEQVAAIFAPLVALGTAYLARKVGMHGGQEGQEGQEQAKDRAGEERRIPYAPPRVSVQSGSAQGAAPGHARGDTLRAQGEEGLRVQENEPQ